MDGDDEERVFFDLIFEERHHGQVARYAFGDRSSSNRRYDEMIS